MSTKKSLGDSLFLRIHPESVQLIYIGVHMFSFFFLTNVIAGACAFNLPGQTLGKVWSPGESMWSQVRKCDCCCFKPSRLKLGKISPINLPNDNWQIIFGPCIECPCIVDPWDAGVHRGNDQKAPCSLSNNIRKIQATTAHQPQPFRSFQPPTNFHWISF